MGGRQSPSEGGAVCYRAINTNLSPGDHGIACLSPSGSDLLLPIENAPMVGIVVGGVTQVEDEIDPAGATLKARPRRRLLLHVHRLPRKRPFRMPAPQSKLWCCSCFRFQRTGSESRERGVARLGQAYAEEIGDRRSGECRKNHRGLLVPVVVLRHSKSRDKKETSLSTTAILTWEESAPPRAAATTIQEDHRPERSAPACERSRWRCY